MKNADKEQMLKNFLQLARTDSAIGQEGKIAEQLVDKLKKLGFQVLRDNAGDTFGGECGNVIGIREGALDGSILLSAHMDRQEGGFGIKPVVRDGVVYSDGTTILAADDLAGVCAILAGLQEVVSSGKSLPRIEVVYSVSEEKHLRGAKAVDKSLLQSKLGYCMDLPGRVGRIVNRTPDFYRLEVEIFGKKAHAGNAPEKGINSAKIMCDILSTFEQGRIDLETTSNFPILRTNCELTPTICDYAQFIGEARSLNPARLESYVNALETHCYEVAEKAGARVTFHKEKVMTAYDISETSTVVAVAKEACEKLGITCVIESAGGGTDGNVYNESGIQCLALATGYSKNHTFEEQLILEDFYQSGELVAALIETYAATCSPAR